MNFDHQAVRSSRKSRFSYRYGYIDTPESMAYVYENGEVGFLLQKRNCRNIEGISCPFLKGSLFRARTGRRWDFPGRECIRLNIKIFLKGGHQTPFKGIRLFMLPISLRSS